MKDVKKRQMAKLYEHKGSDYLNLLTIDGPANFPSGVCLIRGFKLI